MPIQFRCANCNQLLGVARRKAGGMVRCPKCQGQVVAPKPDGLTSVAKQPAQMATRERASEPAPSTSGRPQAASAFGFPPQAQRPPYELIASLIAIVMITVWYVYLAQRGVPQPGGLVGHGLGVVGFVLMLSAETLYSLRKRIPGFTLGRMSSWLRMHIFTGLVGAYLVLLHSAGKLNGLAGVLSLLTVLMVVSGFVGRYIYTAVPRTLDGVEVAVADLEVQIAGADRPSQALGLDPSGATAQAAELETLRAERSRLQKQIRSLAATRRLLALWHTFHIPLGVVLFTLAFIHIGAALYYATFLK